MAEFKEDSELVEMIKKAPAVVRYCSVCAMNLKKVPATIVVQDATGNQWFECGKHSNRAIDHPIGPWVTSMPFEAFIEKVIELADQPRVELKKKFDRAKEALSNVPSEDVEPELALESEETDIKLSVGGKTFDVRFISQVVKVHT